MTLETGSKVLVVHRRLFTDDLPRFFVGVVEAYESGIARVRGHTWVNDRLAGSYYRKDDIRTKLLSISSGTLIVYLLPDETVINHVRFDAMARRLTVTDGVHLNMDLAEYEFHRPSA